jgi:hypothetical protein
MNSSRNWRKRKFTVMNSNFTVSLFKFILPNVNIPISLYLDPDLQRKKKNQDPSK